MDLSQSKWRYVAATAFVAFFIVAMWEARELRTLRWERDVALEEMRTQKRNADASKSYAEGVLDTVRVFTEALRERPTPYDPIPESKRLYSSPKPKATAVGGPELPPAEFETELVVGTDGTCSEIEVVE